jgi:S-adenosylmethionine:tRNA ribosyltransferase-isomerase
MLGENHVPFLEKGAVPKDLLLESYDYVLPPELIADRPAPERHNSKLMVYFQSSGEIIHTTFKEIPQYLKGMALVFNQSKVFPCRLVGQKPTGGKCELFLLSPQPDQNDLYSCLIKSRSKKKVGDQFFFAEEFCAEVREVGEGEFKVSFNKNSEDILSYFESFAKIPIPPYIRKGESDEKDKQDYQTIYAKPVGSVAAPTAGLHFSPEVFEELDQKEIPKAYVTLHVGPGTFAPVKEGMILNHKMHSENYFLDEENLKSLQGFEQSQKKMIAVGTTSLRTLESIADLKSLEVDKHYATDIFIYPGVPLKRVDGLITNFHLPKSTLLMLVSSILGRDKTLKLYEEAKRRNYRFYSYGDAMAILP